MLENEMNLRKLDRWKFAFCLQGNIFKILGLLGIYTKASLYYCVINGQTIKRM